MDKHNTARELLAAEARALLTRIARLSPFALKTPMVTAAAISPAAQTGVESLLLRGRHELTQLVEQYLDWVTKHEPRPSPREAQRSFNILRLRFNAVTRHFDLFANVLAQRAEHETGVWVAGLDDVATDALALPGNYFVAPPVICYLDANHGAAIRRAYTRLPGGKRNPVAVISVPRERMIGSGIASSLVHEVGHQAAALLGLLPSLRGVLRTRQHSGNIAADAAFTWFDKWLSEIVADFWSIARIGVGSTMGLMAVVSLPRPLVFRLDPDDPHPIPWLRVLISARIGQRLYPDPQWRRLVDVWTTLYPAPDAKDGVGAVIARCLSQLDEFVELLVTHRPPALRGSSLEQVLANRAMQPSRLRADFQRWRERPTLLRLVAPCQVFAALGQARADGELNPEGESYALSKLLTFWALKSSLDASALCAPLPRVRNAQSYTALL